VKVGFSLLVLASFNNQFDCKQGTWPLPQRSKRNLKKKNKTEKDGNV